MKKLLMLFILLCVLTFNVCAEEWNYVVVEKSQKTLTVYNKNRTQKKVYVVRTGLNDGQKHCEGDKKTPEGTYHIVEKRDSKYVKFLALDYPNANDRKKSKEIGCNPGNAIGIHYYNEEYTNDPSTLEGSLGCVTVWNKDEILELNKMLKVGATVEIKK